MIHGKLMAIPALCCTNHYISSCGFKDYWSFYMFQDEIWFDLQSNLCCCIHPYSLSQAHFSLFRSKFLVAELNLIYLCRLFYPFTTIHESGTSSTNLISLIKECRFLKTRWYFRRLFYGWSVIPRSRRTLFF